MSSSGFPLSRDDVRPRNRLLAELPPADFARIKAHLQTIPVSHQFEFQRANEPVSHVFFPNGGMASITTALEGGAVIEVATVGDEGLVGIEAMFGSAARGRQAMMQVPDTNAEMMEADAFREEIARGDALTEAVGRYAQGFLSLVTYSAACMAAHSVQERCCRWLLLAHDRVRRDEFHLSQEFLAMMLGSTRPTVSVVASTLQKAGYITYVHGRMTIRDRRGLEAGACECSRAVRAEYDRLGL